MTTKQNWLSQLYAWACECLYHELAWGYDSVSWIVSAGRWGAWRRAALTHVVRAETASKTLEIGFGTGELLIEAAQQERTIIGLELSPAMHAVTAKKLRRKALQIPCVQASALQMPFASNSFNNIISTFPTPYILNPATLSECQRILAPGGRLIIVGLWTTIDHAWLAKLLPLFYGMANQDFVTAIDQRLAAVGLRAQCLEHADGFVRVGIVIAEKSR